MNCATKEKMHSLCCARHRCGQVSPIKSGLQLTSGNYGAFFFSKRGKKGEKISSRPQKTAELKLPAGAAVIAAVTSLERWRCADIQSALSGWKIKGSLQRKEEKITCCGGKEDGRVFQALWRVWACLSVADIEG